MAKTPTQEQYDMDNLAESELAKLQRQYRIMEGDRIAFIEEISAKLSKQKRFIETMRREHKELTTDLRVASSTSNRKKDVRVTQEFENLLTTYKANKNEVKKFKGQLGEINGQVTKMERWLFQLRQKQMSDAQYETKIDGGNKLLKQLENRLETTNKKFCAILTRNLYLREQIDHLLKERANFNISWGKLLDELAQGKKLMLDLIEHATLSYDQREEWCSKLEALRMRGRNDLFAHTQEMRELQRHIHHDDKLHEFLGIKGQKRVMKDLEEKEARRKELEQENMEKEQKNYADILEKIEELTGEADANKFATQFLKREEENFAIFNYINELNHELDLLNDSIKRLKLGIVEQRERNEIKAQEQKDTIESLNARLELIKEGADGARNEMRETKEVMGDLLRGIERLFEVVKCDDAPILELLGKDVSVNTHNVMMYVGLLEKKINEIVMRDFFKQRFAGEKKRKKQVTKH